MGPANHLTVKGLALCHKKLETFVLNTTISKVAGMARISQNVSQPRFQLKYFVNALSALGSFDA
jgi:hypothetical protein